MAFKNPFRNSSKEKRPMDQEQLNNEQDTETGAGAPVDEQNESANADMEAEREMTETEMLTQELEAQRADFAALNEKHLRLFAEFDNFRKRTAKEKLELLQTAGVGTLKSILPVMDDMERAIANNANVEDADAVKEGMKLIHQKFSNLLTAQGVKPMHAIGEPFDPELHEAITKAPAPKPELKGRVIDVVENGYTMNDKVIRYAKVVVGE